MSIRKTNFIEGEYYHLYNRGNDKRVIFHEKQDYYYFISLLFIANSEKNFNMIRLLRGRGKNIFEIPIKDKLVSIGAYVLMPNHFHILLIPTKDNAISKFMQKIGTGYAMYYNKKYNRTGSLFEGKFKSQHLNTDRYLKYIFSYIHLNPVKLIDHTWKEDGIQSRSKSLNHLRTYRYSSFLDYIDGFSRKESAILNTRDFPNYFPNSNAFFAEILGWLNFKE